VRRRSGSLRPETLRQAQEWDRVKRRYIRAGLCHRCAAQASYGHEIGGGGWDSIHPPCAGCAELVAMFAYLTPNPVWRAITRKRI
jgi:hypothetical protein